LHPFKYPRLWLTFGSLLITIVVTLSLWPDPPSSGHDPDHFNFRHAVAYLTLMLWFSNIYSQRSHRIRLSAVFFLMGSCLELLQPLSPGRTLMLTDLLANVVGLLLGIGLAMTFFGTCLIEVDALLFQVARRFKASS